MIRTFEKLELRRLMSVDLSVHVANALTSGDESISYEVSVENLGDETAFNASIIDAPSELIQELSWRSPGFPVALGTSEIDGTNGFELPGGFNARLGSSIEHVGDVNGDGKDDLVIGASGTESEELLTGAVYLIFGSEDFALPELWPEQVDLQDPSPIQLDGISGVTILGTENANIGSAVHGAGDLNSDGFDDLIINDIVLFGRSNFAGLVELDSLSDEDGFRLLGGKTPLGNRIDVGYGGRSAGDVNGDGIDDLVIGGSPPSRVFVLFGTEAGFDPTVTLMELDGSDGFVFRVGGPGPRGSRFSAGDVNGDGLSDLLLQLNAAVTKIYVLYGTAEPYPAEISDFDLDGENGFVISNADQIYSAEIEGDVNGDGRNDIVLHGSEDYFILLRTPEVTAEGIDFGQLGEGLGFFIEFPDRQTLGGNVDATGDVNGDGIDDIVIGGSKAYVIYGRTERDDGRFNIELLDETSGLVIDNDTPFRTGLNFGAVVSNGSDINHDGVSDVFVGAPNYLGGEGFVSVIFGRASSAGDGPLNTTFDLAPSETITFAVQGTLIPNVQGFRDGVLTVTIDGDINKANNSAVYTLPFSDGILRGDINQDGTVAFSDFLILSANFGKTEATPDDGDLDEDGTVGFSDFLILSMNFGP